MKRYPVAITLICLALLEACSSSKTAPSHSPAAQSVAAVPSVAASSSAAVIPGTTAAASSPVVAPPAVRPAGLPGTWHGTYSGSFTGSFVLQWTQASSKLSGTITLSTDPGALPLTGTVSGDSIQFGTVGSQAVTYTGSVSGSAMHGQYQIGGGAAGSGPWSATRG
jgi:hypothetical protein